METALRMPQLLLVAQFIACLSLSGSAKAENWPGWRGPKGDGICVEREVPMDWSPENAVWKTAMSGEEHASPIVWGDRVFTVSAEREKRDRMLVCAGQEGLAPARAELPEGVA
jgi:outer membrane protein assembly factor BamB